MSIWFLVAISIDPGTGSLPTRGTAIVSRSLHENAPSHACGAIDRWRIAEHCFAVQLSSGAAVTLSSRLPSALPRTTLLPPHAGLHVLVCTVRTCTVHVEYMYVPDLNLPDYFHQDKRNG